MIVGNDGIDHRRIGVKPDGFPEILFVGIKFPIVPVVQKEKVARLRVIGHTVMDQRSAAFSKIDKTVVMGSLCNEMVFGRTVAFAC